MSGRNYALGAACLALLGAGPLLAPRAQAQDAEKGDKTSKDRLSLTVRGKATTTADEVSIELTVTGSAEDAKEAEKKYRDRLNLVLNALGKGDGKAVSDEDAPKKKKKKKDDSADDPAKAKKKKKTDDDSDDDAPKAKKKPKKASDDDSDDDAPKAKKKKPKIDDDDDDDAPKAKKKDEKKDDDSAKKDDSKKDDTAKKDDAKKDDTAKKDDAAPKKDDATAKKDEEFPFVIDVKEGGLSFGVKGGDQNANMRRRMMGQQGGKEEPEFKFSSGLSIIFRNVAKADPKSLRKKIAEILDKVSDAGVDMTTGTDGDGTPPVVKFKVADAEDLKIKAYGDAMAAARKRGTNLATLADRALGKVVSVRDQTALPQGATRQVYNPYTYSYQTVSADDFSTEVGVEVDLYVEFELKDKTDQKK
ncbi:MAG TPA: SIMPL domain-containing protein [Planctomycetota bacterium]|nr:SIMPL domain-containing protein [Planctomycetota bacterium]